MKKLTLALMAAALLLSPAALKAQNTADDNKCCSKAVCEKPAAEKKDKKKAKDELEVKFKVNLHCHSCVEKITQNVGFEKGVKDIDVDLEKGIVEIEYNPKKTSPEKLQAAIEKLGYTATIIPEKGKCCGKCDKATAKDGAADKAVAGGKACCKKAGKDGKACCDKAAADSTAGKACCKKAGKDGKACCGKCDKAAAKDGAAEKACCKDGKCDKAKDAK
ncbi:MAG: heavy-metal-associated domain-containing protein [Candidatus Cryptobacteroides sp.]